MKPRIGIEPGKESRTEAADGTWCTLWGYIFAGDGARGVYYVRWNDTSLNLVEFVLSIGEWGDDTGPDERICVSALGRKHDGRLAFMLVDAAESSFADQEFLGAMRPASAVRGTELAREVFAILDQILIDDERVAELRARLEA